MNNIMKKTGILTVTLLIYTLLFTMCSTEAPINQKLIPPLDWIQIGSLRSKIMLHLPISFSKSKISKFFISLTDIKEPSYKKTGIKDIYLFFKKTGDTAVLHAVQMIFNNNSVAVKKIMKMLILQFGKPAGNKWLYKKRLHIDIDKTHPKNCKVTYEIR